MDDSAWWGLDQETTPGYVFPDTPPGPRQTVGRGKEAPVNREVGDANFCLSSKGEREEKVRTQGTQERLPSLTPGIFKGSTPRQLVSATGCDQW